MELGELSAPQVNPVDATSECTPGLVWTPDPSGRARKGLGNNLARKCLERWNAAVGVDEGKNAFQPTSVQSSTNDRK